jgi:hypothetical protein
MHSAVSRSLTSNDAQVDIFRDDHAVSNGTQLLVVPKRQNRLSADGRTVVGSRNPMIKSLNLEAINSRVLTVSSLLRKRNMFVNRSLTANTKRSTQIPWKFASLRHLPEKNGRIAILSVLGTDGPVSRADIRPWHSTHGGHGKRRV